MRVRLVLLLTVFAVSACAKKGDNTRDENGNCTSEYVSDHNNLSGNLRSAKWDCDQGLAFSASRCASSARSILSSCDTYQAHHPAGRTCTAYSYSEGRDVTISTSTVHDACNALRTAMNSPTTTTAPVVTTVPSVPVTPPAVITSPQDARSKYHLPSDIKFASEFPRCEEIKLQSRTTRAQTLSEIASSSLSLSMEQISTLQKANYDADKSAYLSAEQNKLQNLIECIQSPSNTRGI